MRRRISYTFVFFALSLAGGYWAARLPLWGAVPSGMVCLSFLIVAMAYAAAEPGFFVKKHNGRINPFVQLGLLPYLLLNHALLRLITATSKEDAVNLIEDNVYLGRRINTKEFKIIFPKGVACTVDLTAEFSEIWPLRNAPYLLIPTMDTLEPSLEQLEQAVGFIEKHRGDGSVFVHCAMGHGRSATVIAAWLMATKGLGVKHAVDFIKEKRPGIGLHAEQLQLLERFQKAQKD